MGRGKERGKRGREGEIEGMERRGGRRRGRVKRGEEGRNGGLKPCSKQGVCSECLT